MGSLGGQAFSRGTPLPIDPNPLPSVEPPLMESTYDENYQHITVQLRIQCFSIIIHFLKQLQTEKLALNYRYMDLKNKTFLVCLINSK